LAGDALLGRQLALQLRAPDRGLALLGRLAALLHQPRGLALGLLGLGVGALGVAARALGLVFVVYAARLVRAAASRRRAMARSTYLYSLFYLALLFVAIMVDSSLRL